MSTPTPAPLSSSDHQNPTNINTNPLQSQSPIQPNTDIPATASTATTKLAEAIDDFLGDLEKKFKGISDEILTRLDDMAERCDRLEQEMLIRDTGLGIMEGDEEEVEVKR